MRDALLTYGAPFLGALLLSVGIAGGVLGGYSAVQTELGLCDRPLLSVASAERTDRLLAGGSDDGTGSGSGSGDAGPRLRRLSLEDLAAAERAAVEEGLVAPGGEGAVDGAFPNREAFVRGVVVTVDGRDHYVTLVSENECVGASPLLFPLGVVSILLGVAGVLTPPLYRRYVAFERRQR